MAADVGSYTVGPSSECRRFVPGINTEDLNLNDIPHDFLETKEYLRRMVKMYDEHYNPRFDYILECTVSLLQDQSHRISEIWRQKVCEWSYQVIDHYNFNRDVVFIAMNYLDRMVSSQVSDSKVSIAKTEFRLIAVAALFMAIKLHGINVSSDNIRRKLRISSFVELSERSFSISQIEAMESKILSSFDWYVNPPTPLMYIESFLALCPDWNSSSPDLSFDDVKTKIKDRALYLTEVSILASRFTFESTTVVVSYASVLCAVASLKSNSRLPHQVKHAFFKNIADAVDLRPDDSSVLRVTDMLMEILPELVLEENDQDQENTGIEDGKVSPVCVMDTHVHENSDCRRKRSRDNE